MRTTLTLDEDVYEASVHLSKTSGRRLGQVVSELVRRGLRPHAEHVESSGPFPTFDVPADAPIIPASRVQEAIDEEGLF